jgi:hypothetical protein
LERKIKIKGDQREVATQRPAKKKMIKHAVRVRDLTVRKIAYSDSISTEETGNTRQGGPEASRAKSRGNLPQAIESEI